MMKTKSLHLLLTYWLSCFLRRLCSICFQLFWWIEANELSLVVLNLKTRNVFDDCDLNFNIVFHGTVKALVMLFHMPTVAQNSMSFLNLSAVICMQEVFVFLS